jgi:uncharacterized protein YggE
MFTRNRLILAALAGLLIVSLVACGQQADAGGGAQPGVSTSALQTNGQPMPRTISVNGIGTASARPDVVNVQIGVETVNTDAGLAVTQNTERMTAVMDVLSDLAVEDKDVQTVQYSMWIEQPYNDKGEPAGEPRYHVVNQVNVRLHDLTKLGDLLSETLAAGANTVSNISFSVADPTALQKQARDQAIANAKAKAEQLATGLGANVGSLRQVSEYGGIITPPPAPMAEGYGIGGGGAVPVSGGEFSVTVEIQVVFDVAD